MLGIDAPVSGLVVRDMLIKSIYAFFLGWPIYLGVRRALRPALVEDPTACGAATSRRCWEPRASDVPAAPTTVAPG